MMLSVVIATRGGGELGDDSSDDVSPTVLVVGPVDTDCGDGTPASLGSDVGQRGPVTWHPRLAPLVIRLLEDDVVCSCVRLCRWWWRCRWEVEDGGGGRREVVGGVTTEWLLRGGGGLHRVEEGGGGGGGRWGKDMIREG